MGVLADRAAFVTGGAGGLGRAIASALAREGATVAVADLDMRAAEEAAAELPGTGFAVQVDVSVPESVAAAIDRTTARTGELDILVNNAGICPLTSLEGISLAEWNQVLGVNLTGPFLCVQAATAHLQRSRHGRIINISSLAGRTGGVAVGAHYSASKGGLIALTKVLARLFAAHGVTVNCLAPGTLETAMTSGWPAEARDRLRRQVPLGRLGLPSDVAGAVVFLASDAAAFITGATLDVNGGIAML